MRATGDVPRKVDVAHTVTGPSTCDLSPAQMAQVLANCCTHTHRCRFGFQAQTHGSVRSTRASAEALQPFKQEAGAFKAELRRIGVVKRFSPTYDLKFPNISTQRLLWFCTEDCGDESGACPGTDGDRHSQAEEPSGRGKHSSRAQLCAQHTHDTTPGRQSPDSRWRMGKR